MAFLLKSIETSSLFLLAYIRTSPDAGSASTKLYYFDTPFKKVQELLFYLIERPPLRIEQVSSFIVLGKLSICLQFVHLSFDERMTTY